MPFENIDLGDVVALQSHPFLSDLHEIMISGDYQQIPPLMVVSEIFKRYNNNEIVDIEYKCVWFATKQGKFSDTWLSAKLIKKISSAEPVISSLTVGTSVALKSMNIELGKRKNTLSLEVGQAKNEISKTTATALLTFLSPVMQVLSIEDYKLNKGTLKDSNGNQIRHIPSYQVKCTWYNQSSDKYSQSVLPIEVLKVILSTPDQILKSINESIKNGEHYLTEINSIQTIIDPLKIIYRSGYYYVSAFDYLSNQVIEIDAQNIGQKISPLYVDKSPKFDLDVEIKPQNIIDEITAAITKAKSSSAYIRIQYKNVNDKISFRTLRNYDIKENDTDTQVRKYLVGYCHLRDEERTFRIDRIQNLQELNLNFKP